VVGEIAGFLLGVLGTTVGLFLKRLFDKRAASEVVEHQHCDQLRGLQVMLRDSGSLFRDQNFKARQLMRLLQERLPGRIEQDGFEANFRRLHEEFTEEERELFDLIRGTTTTTLHSANSRVRSWLSDNAWARSSGVSAGLASELDRLQSHLDGWLAKYEVTVSQNPLVSLVYMADEKAQGVGFPKNLESVLDSYIAQTCD